MLTARNEQDVNETLRMSAALRLEQTVPARRTKLCRSASRQCSMAGCRAKTATLPCQARRGRGWERRGMALRGRTILCLTAVSAALMAVPLPVQAAPKHLAPVPPATLALMAARTMAPSAPVLLRAYKQESEIEVWKRAADGRFVHLKTFPICRWSGQLGPKTGTATARRRRASIRWLPPAEPELGLLPLLRRRLSQRLRPGPWRHRLGAHGARHLLLGRLLCHDRPAGRRDLRARARRPRRRQAAFQFQAFPFRMTARAMARHRTDRHIAFWRQLKEGSDRFEATGREPLVGVEGGRYTFSPIPTRRSRPWRWRGAARRRPASRPWSRAGWRRCAPPTPMAASIRASPRS